MTYLLLNDYSESAHPDIIKALGEIHLQQFRGYGTDSYSQQVKDEVRKQIGNKNASIHFTMCGTQTNLVCTSAVLTAIDGIISCDTGHIAVNEASAVEATGHKVILAKHHQGKLTVAEIDKVRQLYHVHKPHLVRAKAIYISNPTELGTVYTREELKELYDYCHQHDMYVLMDGARLGSALTSSHQDMNLADIANYTDIFWLGGTKMGALFGEMVVISNETLATDFDIYLKQHGALLAKGFILALQFDVLLKDNKYLDMSRHANKMAAKLSQALQQAGHELFVPTQSNQVFAILPQKLIEKLRQDFQFYTWEELEGNKSIVRLVSSWATDEAQIDRFISLLEE